MDENKRICLIGSLGQDPSVVLAAEAFHVPVITSETGKEYTGDEFYTTYFILKEFQGPCFDYLCQMKCRLVVLQLLTTFYLQIKPTGFTQQKFLAI